MKVLNPALVVAAYGKHALIETATGERVLCVARGKRSTCVVGDKVVWQASFEGGVIESVLPRTSQFHRQDVWRSKVVAANISQLFIMVAAEPVTPISFVYRALIAAHDASLRPVLILGKADLKKAFAERWQRMEHLANLGYTMIPLSLQSTSESSTMLQHLLNHLENEQTLIVGPSGVGKSTLINTLIPDADANTAPISKALNSGKHTTTSSAWYALPHLSKSSALIDTPGFMEFGLHHIHAQNLARWMPDLHQHTQQCRFYNCTHRQEPQCGVREAVGQTGVGGIHEGRYAFYLQLYDELIQN